jgi:hypothetical protein
MRKTVMAREFGIGVYDSPTLRWSQVLEGLLKRFVHGSGEYIDGELPSCDGGSREDLVGSGW